MRGLAISAGAIVWALHFTVLYGFGALACARGFAGAVPWVAGGATLAAVIAVGALFFSGRRDSFERWMTSAVAALALVAIVFEAVPLFIVRPCA